jgi:hypothetical protein
MAPGILRAELLFLDGVYVDSADSSARFRWVKSPTNSELNQPILTIVHRLARGYGELLIIP